MRISDWSSDVCSSDLLEGRGGCLADILEALRWRGQRHGHGAAGAPQIDLQAVVLVVDEQRFPVGTAIGMAPHFPGRHGRSEEHTSELQSLMRISYAVFCLKKKRQHINVPTTHLLDCYCTHSSYQT